jgi:hypothetical protein
MTRLLPTSPAKRAAIFATLLGVLGVLGAVVGLALASSLPPTPTLNASPNVSPTNSPTQTFTFGASGAVAYQCSLNGAAFTACVSPKSYGSPTALTDGSYRFAVRALDKKGDAGSSASYSWVSDRTAPTVSSIRRSGPSPTNAGSVTWTVAFSEPVKGVAAANFSLAAPGLGGTPAITAVSGSGTSYTVAASTGTGSGSLGLNLSSRGTITDLAGNALGGAMPVTGQVYTIDRTPPPAPALGSARPADPTNQTRASFSFTDAEAGVTYQCRLDGGRYTVCSSPIGHTGLADGRHTFSVQAVDAAGNPSVSPAVYSWTVDTKPPPRPTITGGPVNNASSSTASFGFTDSESPVSFSCRLDAGAWSPCTSPQSYSLVSAGTHEFDVRAIDAAGNTGDDTGWKWQVKQVTSGQAFTITGAVPQLLYPGGAAVAVPVTLTNPNSTAIYVTSLAATVQSTGSSACSADWFAIVASTIPSAGVQVPANGSVMLPASGATAPTIRMIDSHTNQNACSGARLTLSYSGNAHS